MNNLFRNSVEDLMTAKISLASYYANWRIKPTAEEKRSYNTTNKILLTFDDFADEKTVKSILDILEKENVKAAFFIVGDWAKNNQAIINNIKKAGHWVGNHTKTHDNLLKLSAEDVRIEILGGPSSTLLRPPYGRYNKKIRKIANELGYKICYWDIDSDDWQGITPDEIKSRVFNSLHAGACILMHLNGKYTVDALPDLIQGIKERGYDLCQSGKEISI